jgi:hypothetical protein
MKVIIAGSRSIDSMSLVDQAIQEALDKWGQPEFTEIVCGCADGVDVTGQEWGEQWYIPITHFPAADYPTPNMRNQAMADYADRLVAVWDGKSRGTKDMVGRMLLLKKPVFEATWTTRHRPLVKRS